MVSWPGRPRTSSSESYPSAASPAGFTNEIRPSWSTTHTGCASARRISSMSCAADRERLSTMLIARPTLSGAGLRVGLFRRARRVALDRVEDPRPRAARQVVPHALDPQRLRTVDGAHGGPAARGAHEPILRAVDDEGGRPDLAQAR